MKIVFHSNQISERGTETAIIDYAFANEKYLGNESIIAFPADKIFNQERYNFFKENFKLIGYTTLEELHYILEKEGIDVLYAIEDGESYPDISDRLPPIKSYKTFVHAVFSVKRKHGDYYCPIHGFLNKFYHTSYPVLPHIVSPFKGTDDTLRDKLHIPADATVFGCYGGKESFDIRFVQECVQEIALKNETTYFIFLNIQPFVKYDGKNIIFLPGTTDLDYKEKFINTVDAMLHARSDGETFGLAVGEFSIKNKPVITYKPALLIRAKDLFCSFLGKRPRYAVAHLENLGNCAITYTNQKELSYILQNIDDILDNHGRGKSYDCFSEKFSAEKVMEIFNEIIRGDEI